MGSVNQELRKTLLNLLQSSFTKFGVVRWGEDNGGGGERRKSWLVIV